MKKVVVITGASGNLGKAICKEFCKQGYTIVAIDLHQEDLAALQQDISDELIYFKCDITDPDHVRTTMEAVIRKFGQIDVLVNNAGITHIERFEKMSDRIQTINKVMNVNFYGAVYCTESCLDALIKSKGSIINISSVAGFAPLLGRTAYAASKHALHGFFESLHSELIDQGVHCMMVCPSFIEAKYNSQNKSSLYQEKKKIGQDISPDKIAKKIFERMIQKKALLLSGKTAHLSHWLRRIMPQIYFNKMRLSLKDTL